MNVYFPYAGEFYSLFCALLWAVGVLLFKSSGKYLEPIVLNMFKNTIALVLFIATMFLAGTDWFPEGISTAQVIVLMASGALGIGIADSIFFASLNKLGAGRSAIVDCLYSPFVVLASYTYLGEPIGPALLLAIAMMASAIVLAAWKPDRGENDANTAVLRTGVMLGIVSMACMAAGIVIAKPILDVADPLWATAIRLAGGWLLLLVLTGGKRLRASTIRAFRPSSAWKTTIPAAVVGAYLAMFFWIAGMKYTRTSLASVLNQTSTIFVVLLAGIFLNESLTARKIFATLLAFGGAAIAILGN